MKNSMDAIGLRPFTDDTEYLIMLWNKRGETAEKIGHIMGRPVEVIREVIKKNNGRKLKCVAGNVRCVMDNKGFKQLCCSECERKANGKCFIACKNDPKICRCSVKLY